MTGDELNLCVKVCYMAPITYRKELKNHIVCLSLLFSLRLTHKVALVTRQLSHGIGGRTEIEKDC